VKQFRYWFILGGLFMGAIFQVVGCAVETPEEVDDGAGDVSGDLDREQAADRSALHLGRACGVQALPKHEFDRIEQEFNKVKIVRPQHAFTTPTTIPVYFHVINNGSGIANGNIPDSQITAQMDVLNAAFASAGLGFQLIQIDRTTNATWYTMAPLSEEETAAKSALHKGGPDTLNIYTANLGDDLGGWATYPSYYDSDTPWFDGVVILYSSVPGGTASPYHLGDTATHEVGHWLGLYHTFEGACDPSPTGGDGVADTPAERGPAFGCLTTRDSCPTIAGLDPVTNFMDYSDNACANNFTGGQVSRMQAMWDTYRLPPPCAHDKCSTGTPLAASSTCGSVVQQICSVDPYCCDTEWDDICVNEVFSVGNSVVCSTGTCSHGLCVTGSVLTPGCDPNGVVNSICSDDPYCCNTWWDGLCVSEIGSIAGKNCN